MTRTLPPRSSCCRSIHHCRRAASEELLLLNGRMWWGEAVRAEQSGQWGLQRSSDSTLKTELLLTAEVTVNHFYHVVNNSFKGSEILWTATSLCMPTPTLQIDVASAIWGEIFTWSNIIADRPEGEETQISTKTHKVTTKTHDDSNGKQDNY